MDLNLEVDSIEYITRLQLQPDTIHLSLVLQLVLEAVLPADFLPPPANKKAARWRRPSSFQTGLKPAAPDQ